VEGQEEDQQGDGGGAEFVLKVPGTDPGRHCILIRLNNVFIAVSSSDIHKSNRSIKLG
jgi:hypothetical protein